MVKFTFLNVDQVYEKEIKILRKRGIYGPATDFCISLSCRYDYLRPYEHSVLKYKESDLLEDRTGSYWLSDTDRDGTSYVVYNEGPHEEEAIDSDERYIGARPVTSYSSICNVCSNKVRTKDGILEVEYGEYPQKAASKKLQFVLENAYKNNDSSITKTGKRYTVDKTFYQYSEDSFKAKFIDEYLFDNGKKYVRLKAQFYSNGIHYNMLSNEEDYATDDYVWIEVQPIKWLIDEKKDIALSERILFAGVQFNHEYHYQRDFSSSDIKKYMDTYFSKDIISSLTKKIVPQKKIQIVLNKKRSSEKNIKVKVKKNRCKCNCLLK